MKRLRGGFVVGVTGHRMNRLEASTIPALSASANDVLAACEQAGAKGSTLVSALAEGADRIIAHAALSRGWKLIVPLPFEPARYVQDFAGPASQEEFRNLHARSHRAWVVGPLLGEPSEGYAAVGDAIVAASHGLVAIWNGKPAAGRGGTAEVITAMLTAKGAVAWIKPGDEGEPRLLLPLQSARAGSQKRALAEAWSKRLETEPLR